MSDTLSAEREAHIAVRLKAATPGPWYWHQPAGFGASCFVRSETDATYRDYSYIAGDVSGFANCDFIAHSRSDVEYLLAALLAARRDADALREYVKASEYWQLAPHDQKERHAYFAKHPAFMAALAATPEEK